MKKIVSMLQPFDAKQKIFAYEDGNKIESIEVETAAVAEGICKLAQSLDIKDINLGGAKQYARGISKRISDIAVTQYSINDLDIKIL